MQRKLIAGLTLCAFFVSLFGGTNAMAATTPTYTITADASTNTGAIIYGGMSGLYALGDSTQPTVADIQGLVHFQYAGQMAPGGTQHANGDAFDCIGTAVNAGMEGMDIYLQDYYPDWPYTNPGITSYVDDVVIPEAQKVVSSLYHNDFRYILFNEPDWIWYGNSGTKLTNFENDWKTAYTALRATDPSAVIIGPSFEAYNASAYDSFFSFCKTNNCLPNVVSWHELGSTGPTPINSDVASFEGIESKYGISLLPIYINEYGRSSGEMARPGRMVQYLAMFENLKVYGEMAAWGQIGYMDDLIGTDNNPTGCWQLFRWYGQTQGNTISVTDSDSTTCNQAMAFHNGGNNVKVIFGGSLNDTDVYNENIVVKGLTGSSAPYTIYGTDYTTTGANSYVVSSGIASISGGTAAISVSGLQSLSAYMLELDNGSSIVSGNTYKISNITSGEMLDVYQESKSSGAKIDQWMDTGHANQQWTLTAVGSNYKITSVNSGLALTEVTSSATVDQESYTGSNTQLWTISAVGNNYKIINVNDGKALDLYQASSLPGANMCVWSYSGAQNQLWQFTQLN